MLGSNKLKYRVYNIYAASWSPSLYLFVASSLILRALSKRLSIRTRSSMTEQSHQENLTLRMLTVEQINSD
uniref:Uncharacterized protein n=1 Tax=Glossina palpalis gambiensis TaxID=67801 RepID=A0A1B0BN01_9MUSC